MANKTVTVTVRKTPEQKRAEREAKLQQAVLDRNVDLFLVDDKGNLRPNPGPSIFDV